MARKKDKIDTSGGSAMSLDNPFAQLSSEGLKSIPTSPSSNKETQAKQSQNKGRVEIRREKKGRRGKTVTTALFPENIPTSELKNLAKELKQSLGCGGTVKGHTLQLSGDRRDSLQAYLQEKAFNPVQAGG